MDKDTEPVENSTEIRFEATAATFTVYYGPDRDRLIVTRHKDGTATVRIGRGGRGVAVHVSDYAADGLADFLGHKGE